MINVLKHALNAVSKIYPRERVSVIDSAVVYEFGYPVETSTAESVWAFLEPLKDDERALYAESVLDATKLRKFYIPTRDGNRVLISKEITPKQTRLKRANGEIYEVFAVNNRVSDGWACVIAALDETEVSDNAND